VLEYLEQLAFTGEEIDWIRRHEMFRSVSGAFFERLRALRFTGDVWAMPEGTLAFANEPLLRIEAPLIEAQLVETFILSMVNFQTMVASKAARILQAAAGKPVVEFGSRRAHTAYAGLYGARAAFIGGCHGTSNVAAGFEFGIPTFGTFAHSLPMAYPSEAEAFEGFWEVFREKTTLLIDTFDALRGTERAARMARPYAAVRIDSGDFLDVSRKMRQILDRHNRQEVKIMATGDLNEYRIEDLNRLNAPIDSFGVGAALATSLDAPTLGGVYKLVEIEREGKPVRTAKFSKDKSTWPGRKQVFRYLDQTRKMFRRDLIAVQDEAPEAQPGLTSWPLLIPAMRNGKCIDIERDLHRAQSRCREQWLQLPLEYCRLVEAETYPVRCSRGLQELLRQARRRSADAEEITPV
jgi:nicotinate phosphoribosyltransferase